MRLHWWPEELSERAHVIFEKILKTVMAFAQRHFELCGYLLILSIVLAIIAFVVDIILVRGGGDE